MPVIASATFSINVGEDHSVELLFLDEINQCGCVNILDASMQLDVPLDELKDTVEQLVGQKKIACDKDHVICCMDKEHFDKFAQKLKALSHCKATK